MSGPVNFIGWLMVGVTSYTGNIAAFKVLLLGGRLVTGFAVGWLCATIPVSALVVLNQSRPSDNNKDTKNIFQKCTRM